MFINKYRICMAILCIILFFLATIGPTTYGTTQSKNQAVFIDHLSSNTAYPGDTVTIYGTGFGSTKGCVIITGQKIQADSWSDTEIAFTVPESGASGFLYVRDAVNAKSNSVTFLVKRDLPSSQFEPYGFRLEDTGLLGATFLIETDGSYFYGISGFETLSTYQILANGSHLLRSRLYLAQRVGDLKISHGYLFISGDHGLVIYRCSDLQNNTPNVIAAIAGGSFLSLDIDDKNGSPIAGTLLALCEYLPAWGTNILRVPLYRFDSGELEYLGCYTRTVSASERYHSIAIDPSPFLNVRASD